MVLPTRVRVIISCSCFVSQEVVWVDDSKKEPIAAALRAGGCSLRLMCSVFVWSPFLFVSHDHRFLSFCWGLSLIIGFVSQATRMKRCSSSGSALACILVVGSWPRIAALFDWCCRCACLTMPSSLLLRPSPHLVCSPSARQLQNHQSEPELEQYWCRWCEVAC